MNTPDKATVRRLLVLCASASSCFLCTTEGDSLDYTMAFDAPDALIPVRFAYEGESSFAIVEIDGTSSDDYELSGDAESAVRALARYVSLS